MDVTQKTVKRQASFCNAITFTNRPIAVYEQVRLKVLSYKSCSTQSIIDMFFPVKLWTKDLTSYVILIYETPKMGYIYNSPPMII